MGFTIINRNRRKYICLSLSYILSITREIVIIYKIKYVRGIKIWRLSGRFSVLEYLFVEVTMLLLNIYLLISQYIRVSFAAVL